jgi:hypothetical protein
MLLQELPNVISFFAPIGPHNHPIQNLGFGKLNTLALLVVGDQVRRVRDDAVNLPACKGVNLNEDIFGAGLLALSGFLIEARLRKNTSRCRETPSPQKNESIASAESAKAHPQGSPVGGITALTVAMEALADRVVMAELDSNVAAVWKVS